MKNVPQHIKITAAKMPVTPGNFTARNTPTNPNDITITFGKCTLRRRRLLGDVIYTFLDVDGLQRKLNDDSGNIERLLAASIEGSGEEPDYEPRPAIGVESLPIDPRTVVGRPGMSPSDKLNQTRYV